MPPKQAPKAAVPKTAPVEKAQRAVKVSQQLSGLLSNKGADARTVVDFIMGPSCGLERQFKECDDITPLLMAVKANRLDVVQLLLSEHSPNTKAVDADGYTALHYASSIRNPEMVRCLAKYNGSLIDSPANDGSTPLHYSLSDAHDSATALLLLDLGANPHTFNTYFTPLHLACMHGLDDVARALLVKGAPVNACDVNHNSLYFAVGFGHSSLALLLLEAGADPSIADTQQETPLHVACYQGLVDVAMALLAKRAPVNARGYNGNSPLHIAIDYKHNSLALLLLDFGADPNIANNNQQTPLHIACEKGFVDVASSLLALGAPVGVYDGEGKTPLECARHAGSVSLLKAEGARVFTVL